MKQEGQFKSTSGKELTGAAITFKNGNVVTASDSGKPTGPATITLNSDGSQSDVMSAAKETVQELIYLIGEQMQLQLLKVLS